MHAMKLMNKTLALFIVSLFALSFIIYGSSATIPESSKASGEENSMLSEMNPVDRGVSADEGTNVNWYTESGSRNDTWTWQQSDWIYGPRSTYEIYYENATLLQRDDFIPLNEEVTIRVNVNKAVLKDAGIESVSVGGSFYVANYDAHFSFDFYNGTPATWSAYSYAFNYTSGLNDPPYTILNEVACSLTSDSNMYYLVFKGTFTSNTPSGLYWMYVSVYDTEFNHHQVYSRWASDYHHSDEIAIGIPYYEAYADNYWEFYTIEKLDLYGDSIYSVSRGTDFMMRLNITQNGNLGYAILYTYSYDVEIPVNMSGPHNERVFIEGGWVYDSEADTYVYDASAQIYTVEQVYGDYVGTQRFFGYPWVEYNYRWLQYHWENDTYSVQHMTGCSEELKLMLVYNFTSGSFQTIYGFFYRDYPSDTYIPGIEEGELVFYSLPLGEAPVVFIELNETLSNVYTTDRVTSVEFVLHFTEQAPKGTLMEFNELVFDSMGHRYGPSVSDLEGDALMTHDQYREATEIAVESPATIAKLLREDGTPVRSFYFPTEAGEPFTVLGRLQGGSDVAEDIDGVLLQMTSYSGYWTENEWGYSDLYYEVQVESDSTVVMRAYNFTMKENYTFGTYFDYNTWQEVEGWHWEHFYFNQKTSEWVSWQDWYYDYKSEATAISQEFASVDQITKYTSAGDLYFSFRLNLTDAIPESSLFWDFQFANYTWVQDQNSYYGYHESGIWMQDWIHSFDYMGTEIYFDVSTEIAVFSNHTSFGASDWVAVEEAPYITIEGVNHPIVMREIMYPNSLYTEERFLFSDYEGYYYELVNGTKVYIESQRNAWIFSVTVPGYGSFLSAQDACLYWYDGIESYYSWWDIAGNLHQGTDSMIWSYNVVVEPVGISTAEPSGYYVRVGAAGKLDVKDSSERYDSRTATYYLVGLDDTRYDIIKINYDSHIMYESVLQKISCVEQSYEGDYSGSPVFVAHQWVMKEQHFVVGTDYEMPYPGAMADYWGVRYTQSQDYAGKVPSSKTIIVNDRPYLLGGNPDTQYWYEGETMNHTGFWVMIDSYNISLDGRKMYAAWVNGSYMWNPWVVAGSFEYGYFDDLNFIAEGTIIAPDKYIVDSDWNSTFYFDYNHRVDFENGTVFSCEPRVSFEVYLVEVNGSLVYTRDTYTPSELIGNVTYYYVTDLDGIRHYQLEWGVDVLSREVVLGWKEYDNLGVYSFNYIVNGTPYSDDSDPYGRGLMVFTNGSLAGKYFYDWGYDIEHDPQDVYEILFDGANYTVVAQKQYIFKRGWVEGLAYTFGLAPIDSVVFKNIYEIIVGNPEWSMWGVNAWSRVPETNALDLDGDISTTDDQYFVLQEYQSTNSWSSEYSRMWVNLMWDPNSTLYGDEMNIHSWMGWETNTWSYTWQQTYYWFKADDMSPVSSAEFALINSTVFDVDGRPLPGYWDIAHMAKNITWADILAEAEANGWDWITEDEQTWSWLSFGVGQSYGVYSETEWVDVSLRYEFSGLMLWEDSNNNSIMETSATSPGDYELTHYFIPDNAESVSFVTPGEAFGNYDSSGQIVAGVEDEISWGVTFTHINGTTFPFNSYAYWDWYDGLMTGTDLRTFDERPTKTTIDELEFLVHFQGHLNTTLGATTNHAELKVDNTVGTWGVNMVGGIDNLEGRSLALNYHADVAVSSFSVRSNGSEVTEESTTPSAVFEMVSGSARFAEMIIGGVTYDWAKDPYSIYNVTSQTTPLSTFRAAYESDNGVSATSWAFSSTQYYVSIGFPQWDGYRVYQDPIFVGYISNSGHGGGEAEVNFSSFSIFPEVPSATDVVQVGVDVSTDLEVYGVELQFSTNGVVFDSMAVMSEESPFHYVGEIPPHAEDTQVWYKIVVHTESGDFESAVQSYIVGSGVVTSTTSTTTGPQPTDLDGLPMELIMLVGAFGLVVIVVALLAKRRK